MSMYVSVSVQRHVVACRRRQHKASAPSTDQPPFWVILKFRSTYMFPIPSLGLSYPQLGVCTDVSVSNLHDSVPWPSLK